MDTNEQENKGFSDPVLRCDSCNKLILTKDVHKIGTCPRCGNRRVREVRNYNDDDLPILKSWLASNDIDQAFLDQFAEVSV